MQSVNTGKDGIVFDLAVPASAEFVLNRLTPPDDHHHVGVIVRGQQPKTGSVVESAIEIDGLDAEVKAVGEFEKLSKDIVSGIASDKLADRQRVPFVAHPCVQRRVRVKSCGSPFRL